jgi:hypothetical protein
VDLFVSPAILDEVAEVLEREFKATPEEVAESREIIMDAARIVNPKVQLSGAKGDSCHSFWLLGNRWQCTQTQYAGVGHSSPYVKE